MTFTIFQDGFREMFIESWKSDWVQSYDCNDMPTAKVEKKPTLRVCVFVKQLNRVCVWFDTQEDKPRHTKYLV